MSKSVSVCVRAQVKKTDDSIGPEVESAVKDLQNGEVSAFGRGMLRACRALLHSKSPLGSAQ